MKFLSTLFFTALYVCLCMSDSVAQTCTTLGQTPSTAFPVCGTTTFHQAQVPLCATNSLFVPGCSGSGTANYENRNPFFYKFTCYVSGTLGFVVTPAAADEDYDWQLYDITGQNPDAIFTNNSLVVTGNWAGTFGATGTSANGANFIQCASVPSDNAPSFARMPNLIAGHQYLLMISHFTNTQSGYSLSFGGGTAVITDPKVPHMDNAKADCDGTKLTVKLNKKMRCNTLTGTGSEFSLSPAAATVTSATTTSCSAGFDFDELVLTLSAPLTNGMYQLIINNGSDGNTLLDNCGTAIAGGESVTFTYNAPQPIFADSIERPKCAPDSVRIFFPKKILCNTIAADGSDFSITGPGVVNITGATGNCINGKTDYIVVKFAAPIYTQGNYLLTLKAGSDGTVVIDECGQETPTQSLPFVTADTVNSDFAYTTTLGCRFDTLTFTHDGAHNVNFWSWRFNNATPVLAQTHTISFSASSTNVATLLVSNGVCSDTASETIVLDNEVRADFTMPPIICPEDKLEVDNLSEGAVDTWLWKYDIIGTSTLEDPPPFQFPTLNHEAYYSVKLITTNLTIGCSDSLTKTLTVLDHCFIAVPSAFTPNNDGLNDYFWPHNALKANNYVFKVYNRWGQLVFQTNDWQKKWDGRINGVVQATGVYVWMLSYTHRDTGKAVFQKGTVALIR